jgi:hypothetical protein
MKDERRPEERKGGGKKGELNRTELNWSRQIRDNYFDRFYAP